MPTLQEIEAKKTAKGGWTRTQLAEWGVPWPPPKGWKKALIAADTSGAAARIGERTKKDEVYDAAYRWGYDFVHLMASEPESWKRLAALVLEYEFSRPGAFKLVQAGESQGQETP